MILFAFLESSKQQLKRLSNEGYISGSIEKAGTTIGRCGSLLSASDSIKPYKTYAEFNYKMKIVSSPVGLVWQPDESTRRTCNLNYWSFDMAGILCSREISDYLTSTMRKEADHYRAYIISRRIDYYRLSILTDGLTMTTRLKFAT